MLQLLLSAVAPAPRPDAPAARTGLVHVDEAAAQLARTRGTRDFAVGVCRALANVAGLDGAQLVRLDGTGAETMAAWARSGRGAARIGDAALVPLLAGLRPGGAVELPETAAEAAGLDPERRLIAVPVAADGRVHGAAIGVRRRPSAFSTDELEAGESLVESVVRCPQMANALRADELRGPVSVGRGRGGVPGGVRSRATEQMQLLQSLSATLTRARSESEVAHAVVSELRTFVDYHSCRFYLVSDSGTHLLPIAYHGVGRTYESDRYEDLICTVGHGVGGRLFAEQRSALIADAQELPFAEYIEGTEHIEESMVVAPIVSDSGALGIIVLTKEGRDQFDDEDLRLLEIIAAHAAVACENSRLYARVHESAEVSEALLDLGGALALQSTVEGIANMLALAADRLVECAAISVWLRDGDRLVPAAVVGYTPEEQRRLREARIDIPRWRLARVLDGRRVVVGEPSETPVLAGALDIVQPGTTFAFAAIGERAANRGMLAVQRGPRRGAPSARDERMLLGIADQALPAITNRVLYEELENSFLATVEALANALEMKDEYTNEHAQALIGLTHAVARRMGVAEDDLRDMSFAAALHDIGKIGIPAEILQKPGPLTDDEFEVMKQHPALGARIIEPITELAGARELVLSCHEHWNGGGYPRALRGESIPLGARIILAVDAYHAMTSDRVYRAAMTDEEAVAELSRCSGSHFDPAVVDALTAVIRAGEAAHVHS